MAGLHDLSAGAYFADRDKRQRAMETAAPLRNASIGAGGLRVHSGGVITIENGGLRVTGTAEIIGKLIASGQIEFNGPVRITGPLDITGLTQIMGDLAIKAGGKLTAGTIELNPDGSAKFGTLTISPTGKLTSGSATIDPDGSAKFGLFEVSKEGNLNSKGTLDIRGKTTLRNDLTVLSGGKVKVGGVTLNPVLHDGGVVFSNGTYLASTSMGAQLLHPDGGVVAVSSGQAEISSGTGRGFIARTDGVAILGMETSTTAKANVYIDSYGRLKRITDGGTTA